ncbi:hypothetical protein AEGHOMDF_1182 [Methylobacterium soli]|nr:hypothetical protein AEGHOMDF_1182 [Methylobacterium soli]
MPGHHDGEEARQPVPQSRVGLGHHLVLARMRARRDPDRAVADHLAEIGHLLAVGRGHGRIVFEVARHADPRGAEPGEALRIVLGLRQADGDAGEERLGGAGRALPALEGALRHAPVDEEQRDVAGVERHDRVGPDLGFGHQREIGLPMVEEALDPARRVERHVLVHGPGGQPVADQLGRAPRARGDEDREAAPDHALDEADQRERLADARPVHPDQRADRAGAAGEAAALGQAARILLAPARAPGEETRHRRLAEQEAVAIGPQRQGEGRRLHAGGPTRSRRPTRV